MSQQDPDLWKLAYQKQFGSDPDEDQAEHADEIEEWRQHWQAGYDAGEEWATSAPERRRAIEVPDVNHFSIVLGARGARTVAGALTEQLAIS